MSGATSPKCEVADRLGEGCPTQQGVTQCAAKVPTGNNSTHWQSNVCHYHNGNVPQTLMLGGMLCRTSCLESATQLADL